MPKDSFEVKKVHFNHWPAHIQSPRLATAWLTTCQEEPSPDLAPTHGRWSRCDHRHHGLPTGKGEYRYNFERHSSNIVTVVGLVARVWWSLLKENAHIALNLS